MKKYILYSGVVKLAFMVLCLLMAAPHIAIGRDSANFGRAFLDAGLILKSDESAEEIVLRAHRYDTGAVMAAVAGYARGIGGFPYDPQIAGAWAGVFKYLDEGALSLSLLFLWEDGRIPDEDFSYRAAMCATAKGHPFSIPFKDAGLFDLGQFCRLVEEKKSSVAEWGTRRQVLMAEQEAAVQRIKSTALAVRTLREQPANKANAKVFFADMGVLPMDIIVFFAATAHEPRKEAPDWSAEKLLKFLGALKQAEGYLHELSIEYDGAVGDCLSLLSTAAASRLVDDKQEAMSLIRAAHTVPPFESIAGMVDASSFFSSIRRTASNYSNGTLGFIKNAALARCWLQHAALAGDAESMFLLAVECFAQGKTVEAWAWTHLLRDETGMSISGQIRSAASQLNGIIENMFGEDIRGDGMQKAYYYFGEKAERLKRYAAGE